jgi:uncharacterized membrane protein
MKYIFIFLFITGCQDYNSNSSDRSKYGPIVLDENDPNFAPAYNVIQNRCVSCHSSPIHNPWSTYTNNEKWLDPDNSYFVQRIINYGGSSANMPQGGSSLPQAEYDAIRTWIENIQ